VQLAEVSHAPKPPEPFQRIIELTNGAALSNVNCFPSVCARETFVSAQVQAGSPKLCLFISASMDHLPSLDRKFNDEQSLELRTATEGNICFFSSLFRYEFPPLSVHFDDNCHICYCVGLRSILQQCGKCSRYPMVMVPALPVNSTVAHQHQIWLENDRWS
jgi:hypothetical protein